MHSPVVSRYRLSLLLLVFSAMFWVCTDRYDRMFFTDGDPGWHLAAGDYIREIGAIPARDPWSFTSSEKWYNLAWLHDVWLSFSNEWFGLSGTMVVTMGIAAAAVTMVAYAALLHGSGMVSLTVAVLVSGFLIYYNVTLRPQLWSIFFAALCYVILLRNRSRMSGILWLLPFINILWVNMHGGFLVLYTLIGAFWLEAMLQKNWPQAKRLFAVGVVCLLTTLINPYGIHISYGTSIAMESALIKGFLLEWRPVDYYSRPHLFYMLASMIAIPFFRRPTVGFATALLCVFWGLMTFNINRNSAIFVIFFVPLLVDFLEPIGMRLPAIRITEAWVAKKLGRTLAPASIGFLTACLVLYFAMPPTRALQWDEARILDMQRYPIQEIEYLKQHYPGENILNEYSYGGYIIYLARNQLRPFIDGRAETVYSAKHMRNYVWMDQCAKPWEDILQEYPVRVALLPNLQKRSCYPSEKTGWEKVYVGPVATVYAKKENLPM